MMYLRSSASIIAKCLQLLTENLTLNVFWNKSHFFNKDHFSRSKSSCPRRVTEKWGRLYWTLKPCTFDACSWSMESATRKIEANLETKSRSLGSNAR